MKQTSSFIVVFGLAHVFLAGLLPAANAASASTKSPSITFTGDLAYVRSEMILADVNGVSITLKDLMSINPSKPVEQTMGTNAFQFLLDRAIERELTFQEAKKKGLELTQEQKKNEDRIRADALERAAAPYVSADYDGKTQGDFEARDYEAMVLMNALLNESGPPTQYVKPERVQAYYDEHQADFGKLPKDPAAHEKAWQNIDMQIRTLLIPEINAEHEKKRRQLLEDLKAGSTIEQFVTFSGE